MFGNIRKVYEIVMKKTASHRRLAILNILDASPQYKSNLPLIADCMRELGLSTSEEILDKELAGLESKGLLRTNEWESVQVVELTTKGQEVSNGILQEEGIARARIKSSE